MRELNLDASLSNELEPIAIFKMFNEDGSHFEDQDSHFIAIAEHKKLPIYFNRVKIISKHLKLNAILAQHSS